VDFWRAPPYLFLADRAGKPKIQHMGLLRKIQHFTEAPIARRERKMNTRRAKRRWDGLSKAIKLFLTRQLNVDTLAQIWPLKRRDGQK